MIRNKYEQIIFTAIATITLMLFGIWWFTPTHVPNNFTGIAKIFDYLLFFLVTYIIWHPFAMEALTWAISSHIKNIRHQKPLPASKVAFITTIVPKNEPLSLLHKCLPAMKKAKYPHDTWLLDEGNDPEARKICKKYGVYYFTRSNKPYLNTSSGKYTKTKGGNHNSWYDIYGHKYDFVAQIDTDFVPKSTFLTKTLGYFRDPKVAFVGTPQIYGNTKKSFIARGANEQQLSFYGAVLRGLSGMGMTLLIGANHIIRVNALRKVGHYTAHITEDLITGMKLHAHGWKSIYIPNALCLGEGPSTWDSYFNQQLRWAYGCIDILFHHSFKYFKKMSIRQTIYYFLLQQHYFTGIAMVLSTFLLSIYFIFGIRTANVDLLQFFLFYSASLLTCWFMSIWLQRFDIHKKQNNLQLAGKIISISAWPIWFIAFASVLIGKRLNYKITPKGELDKNDKKIDISYFLPHLIFGSLALIGLITSFFTHQQSIVMIFWAAFSISTILILPFTPKFAEIISLIHDKTQKYLYRNYLPRRNSTHSLSKNQKLLKNDIQKNNLFTSLDILQDSLFLITITFISIFPYINKLGFYSDDWSFIGQFRTSPNQSIPGLIQVATTPNTFMRPLQNIYDAVLYWLFGFQPLGYHTINSFVFISIIVLLYIILRAIPLPRIISISIPLVFALLPNYSTDRFWYAAFQVNLSMLLYLLSTYAGIRAFYYDSIKKIQWKLTSIFCLIGSALSYEVALPLIFINIFLFLNPIQKFRLKMFNLKFPIQNSSIFIVLNIIVLFYLAIFKAKTTTRIENFNYLNDTFSLVTSVFNTNLGTLFLKTPFILNEIISKYLDTYALVFGAIIFIFTFFYIYLDAIEYHSFLPGKRFMRNLIIIGLILFLAGYAIFLTNNNVGFSPTGIDNRVAIAASIGIAFMIVGLIGLISQLFFLKKYTKLIFSLLISISCLSGFLIIYTISTFWTSAYQKGQDILTRIYYSYPVSPKNSTLILDGVCPYSGPGIIFESQWDLKGALQASFNEASINADIVTPRLKVTNKGLETQIYTLKAQYPYKNLYIYNFNTNKYYVIKNKRQALRYFNKFNPDHNNNCPPASAGNGVSIF